jgi:hypothetical protein
LFFCILSLSLFLSSSLLLSLPSSLMLKAVLLKAHCCSNLALRQWIKDKDNIMEWWMDVIHIFIPETYTKPVEGIITHYTTVSCGN